MNYAFWHDDKYQFSNGIAILIVGIFVDGVTKLIRREYAEKVRSEKNE